MNCCTNNPVTYPFSTANDFFDFSESEFSIFCDVLKKIILEKKKKIEGYSRETVNSTAQKFFQFDIKLFRKTSEICKVTSIFFISKKKIENIHTNYEKSINSFEIFLSIF